MLQRITMEQLDLAIRTLFGEFQETVWNRHRLEQAHADEETFAKKQVKGKTYWYTQRYSKGQAVQKYFAPSTPETDIIVQKKRGEQKNFRQTLKEISSREEKMLVLLRRAGLPSLDRFTSDILISLLNTAAPEQGPILVGSHAFAAYAGILGTLFDHALLKMHDIGLACETSFELFGKPTAILPLLKEIDSRFRAVPGFTHNALPQTFIGPAGIRVDLLAPLQGKPKPAVKIKNLIDAAATPLPFLDFLIREPVRGVLLGPKSGIAVWVPHPVRFGLHKLMVASRRPATETAKKKKDLAQAEQILKACAVESPAELNAIRREALKSGRKWKKALTSIFLQSNSARFRP